jgi:hypothetical protein
LILQRDKIRYKRQGQTETRQARPNKQHNPDAINFGLVLNPKQHELRMSWWRKVQHWGGTADGDCDAHGVSMVPSLKILRALDLNDQNQEQKSKKQWR